MDSESGGWIKDDGWRIDEPGGGEDRGDGGSSSSLVISSTVSYLYLTGRVVGVVAVAVAVVIMVAV
jgi:hypothetical protein